MLHRRLLFDDARGVGEPLNETEPIRTREWLILDTMGGSARQHRPKSLLLNNPPLLMFGQAVSSPSQWINTYETTFTPLVAALPPNLHLLSFYLRDNGEYLVRLNHIYPAGEDSQYSQPVTIDLQQVFAHLDVVSITEMSLTANQPITDIHRLNWRTVDVEYPGAKTVNPVDYGMIPIVGTVITLRPMEIRTFLVRFQSR